MYVIAMKNRRNELSAMRTLQSAGYLRSDMLPLIEIIKEEKHRYGKDASGAKHDPTLHKISELFAGREVLVDYFRCDLSCYRYNPANVELVIRLNWDLKLYAKKVVGVLEEPNLIPVIAVKRSMDDILEPKDLVTLIDDIRQRDAIRRIAIRIDDIEGYEEALAQTLREGDYLIYDFNEQPLRSKPMECRELCDLALSCQTIALCSPRSRELTGKNFKNGVIADFIDTPHLDIYRDLGFDGVGDYGGLRDNLHDKGSNKGRALALFYFGRSNVFKSYVKDDYELGPSGYYDVVESMLEDNDLANDSECCALGMIVQKYNAREKAFTFAEWVKYTLMRYIQQLATTRPLFD